MHYLLPAYLRIPEHCSICVIAVKRLVHYCTSTIVDMNWVPPPYQGLDRDTGNDFEAMSQLPHRSYEGLDRDTGMTLKPCQGRAQVE